MTPTIQFVDEGETLKTNNPVTTTNTSSSSSSISSTKCKDSKCQKLPVRPKQKRERAAHSKTRTGCRTCKARRIKCDEKRPACLRCTTTGRTCDGYEPPNPTRWLVVTAPPQPTPHQIPNLSIQPTAYPDLLLEDGSVRLSFEFFRQVAAPELSYFFGKTFWSESLLSTSHQFPAVMSALVALSSLHRRLKDGKPIKGDLFAGRQYEKSLKQLIRSISSATDKSHSRLMSLLCGVIYTIIEVLHGSWKQARQHLDGIIQLLNEERSSKAIKAGSEDILVADTVVRDLHAIIIRFDIEAATYSNGRPPLVALSPLKAPTPGANLDQIEAELCDLMLHSITLLHCAKAHRYEILDQPVPEDMLYDQQQIATALSAFWDCYEPTLKEAAGGVATEYDTRRASSLIVQYHHAWTSLNCCLYPRETDYDQYYSNFVELVHYATITHTDCVNRPAGTSSSNHKPDIDPNIDPSLASYVHPSTSNALDTSNTVLDLNTLLNPQSRTPSPPLISTSSHASPSGSSPSSPTSKQSTTTKQYTPPPYPKPTGFSPETGVLFPLFWAATRCRDGYIRRLAVEQLLLCNQEGVWCPGAQARVASRVIELEEGLEPWAVLDALVNNDNNQADAHGPRDPDVNVGEGLGLVLPKASDIPEHRRCHQIVWPVDRVNRTGDMAYAMLPRGVEGGWDIRYAWVL